MFFVVIFAGVVVRVSFFPFHQKRLAEQDVSVNRFSITSSIWSPILGILVINSGRIICLAFVIISWASFSLDFIWSNWNSIRIFYHLHVVVHSTYFLKMMVDQLSWGHCWEYVYSLRDKIMSCTVAQEVKLGYSSCFILQGRGQWVG